MAMNLGLSSANPGKMMDRRATSRFPMDEEVTYRVMDSRTVLLSGSGRTLNVGSGGILFSTEGRLPLGHVVDLSVNWPARLDGTCPLKFVASGRIVRSELGRAVVRIERYEFRTRGTAAAAAKAVSAQ